MMIRSIHGVIAKSFDNLDILVRNFSNEAQVFDINILLPLNTFVLTLRSNNLLAKFNAIYPFVGATGFSHKFNLINPEDSDSAFRLSFVGSWGHNSNGIQPNGINTHANTFYNEAVNASLNDKHIAIYSRTNIQGLFCDIGVFNGVSTASDIIPRYFTGGAEQCFMRNSSSSGMFNNTDSRGFFLNNRNNSTQIRASKNGVANILTSASSVLLNGNYYISSTNNYTAGSTNFRSNRNLSFASIGSSFTDVEEIIFYNAVQTLQTSLGRAV